MIPSDFHYWLTQGFPSGAAGKEATRQCRKHKRCRFNPWIRKIPWTRIQQPTPVFLAGKSREPGGLYSPQGCKESDTTEATQHVGLLAVCVCAQSVISDSWRSYGLQPSRFLCPWDFPGKNTGVGCHFLLQGIFLTQGLNQHLLHWQKESLSLCHLGIPAYQLYISSKYFVSGCSRVT